MRRRHQTQPETFPFLAVLLCAMGSLILVLLEFDRRARANAQDRIQQARKQQEREQAELLARLRAQRHAEREARLAKFRQEDQALLEAHRAEQKRFQLAEQKTQTAAQEIEAQTEQLLREIQQVREKLASEDRQTEAEQQRLLHQERTLAERQSRKQKTRETVALADTKREQMTRDLLLLEEALAQLKERRQRESRMVSIVPYVGKRGQNRQPLYVECAEDRLVFHPDRLPLVGLALNAEAIRAEVKKRGEQLTRSAPTGSQQDPYWMVIVRPSGIRNYYLFLEAIRPLELTYGYEFVDPGWDLDFPDSANAPPPVVMETPLPTPVRKASRGAPSPARPAQGTTGLPAGSPAIRVGTGPGPGTAPATGSPSSPGGAPVLGTPVLGAPAGPATPAPGSGAVTEPIARLAPLGVPPGNTGPAAELQSPRIPTEGTPSPQRVAETPSSASSGPTASPGSAGSGEKSSAEKPPTASDPPAAPPSSQPSKTGSLPPEEVPSEPGNPGEGKGKGNASQGSKTPSKSPPPVRREWVVIVECLPDEVRVSPSRTIIPLTDLSQGEESKALLVDTIRELIQKRVASFATWETPPRIVIRFLVHKGALRTYHTVYPLLEAIPAQKRTILPGE